MTEKFESNKETGTQGKLTTILDSCHFCNSKANILTLLVKPEVISALPILALTAYVLLLISLFLMGKVSAVGVTTAVALLIKYAKECL
jgi:hypothetical protein